MAIIADRPVGADLSWAGHQLGARRNPHGWGVAWLERPGVFRSRKQPCQLPAGRRGRKLIRGIRSVRFVAHTRYRVKGAITLANTQPFVSPDGQHAFSGTMVGCGRRGFHRRVRDRLAGQTGTEVLFQLLVLAVERDGASGLPGVVSEFFDSKTLPEDARASFVFCARDRVFLFRHRKPLYYLRRSDAATVVASEKLTGEDWLPVPDRQLLAVGCGRIRPVRPTAS
jgi:predicted glutamine amidotransferase